MGIWILIMAALLAAVSAGVAYLGIGFSKFGWMKALANGKTKLAKLFGCALVIVILMMIGFALNYMNAIVIFLHLCVFWMLGDLTVYLLRKAKGITLKRNYAGIAAIGITVVYLSVAAYLCINVWEKDYHLTTDKELGSLKVAMIADSHMGTTFDGDGFAEHLKKINAANPDLLIIAGDFVDDDSNKADLVRACQALGEFDAPYGVYYSFGNHDKGYFEGRDFSADELVEELVKNGVKVLEDESVLIDDRFYVIGRADRSEDQRGNSRKSMEELMQDLDQSKYMITIDHQPHDYKRQEEAGVDLVLSGHTHGGQLLPINYVGEWSGENDKTYGLAKKSRTDFIVTSGISDWAILFKTGCKSEFVMIDIEGK